jgi:hypothetical protein
MAENNQPKRVINATTKKQSVAHELGNYAMEEIIVPKSKEVMRDMFTGIVNMFADALRSSVDRVLYPDGNAPVKRQGNGGYYTGTTNYQSFSRPIGQYQPSQQRGRDPIGQRAGCDVRYIWVPTEDDAKELIGVLREDIDNYGKAKVATLYEKIGERTTFADFKFGWADASQLGYSYDPSSPDPARKWFIDLPKPVDITGI